MENPIIYNHFTHGHGIPNFGSDHIGQNIGNWRLEYTPGSIEVVHRPTYTDMGSWIHFNPSPVFVPEPSGVFLIVLALTFMLRRSRMYSERMRRLIFAL